MYENEIKANTNSRKCIYSLYNMLAESLECLKRTIDKCTCPYQLVRVIETAFYGQLLMWATIYNKRERELRSSMIIRTQT